MTFASTGSTTFFTTTTFSLTPAGTGDLIAVAIINDSNKTVYASSLASTNATWTAAGHFLASTNTGTGTIFLGKTSSTSTATVTITWSGTAPGTMRNGWQEFTSTVGSWAVDGSLGDIDSAGTNTWVSLTPAGSGDLYFGFAYNNGTASAGSTSGYTYSVDGHGNGMAYNAACTSSAQAPVWADSTQAFGPMVLVRESAGTSVSGVVSALTLAAPAGSLEVDAARTGAVSPLALAAPAGSVASSSPVAGAVSPLALAAPAGSLEVDAARTGAVAPLALAAPAGSLEVDAPVAGAVSALSLAAPAGSIQVDAAVAGVVSALALMAPAGGVQSGGELIAGPVSVLTLAAPAGSVSASSGNTDMLLNRQRMIISPYDDTTGMMGSEGIVNGF